MRAGKGLSGGPGCRSRRASPAGLKSGRIEQFRELALVVIADFLDRERVFALSKAQVRLAQAAMAQRDTSVSDLCKELGIERVTLYRYVGPNGELRDYGQRVLAAKTR